MVGLSAVLMGAGVAAASSPDGTGPHISTDGGMTLQLTSTMPGVTFNGTTLVCPPMLIAASSGENLAACEFTISSIGAVAPSSLAVTMTVSGITPAQVAAHKFAIAPQPGQLAYLGTTSQTLYTFTGAQLPVTVNPGVVWGANAGTGLDNSDMDATIVVTYTVVAESAEGATGAPVASATPVASGSEAVEGATAVAGETSTLPPTASSSNSSSDNSTPLFPLLICFLFGAIGLIAAQYQRRSLRRYTK
jgi:hypothetical protein